MAGREDGEFELILGNRQLLAVLFIVIVLLGVFFVMGFLAGRSTSGVTVAQKQAAEKPPLAVDAATTPDPNPPATAEPLKPETVTPPAAEPPKEPAKEVKEPPKPEPVKEKEPEKPAKKEEKKEEKKAKEEKASDERFERKGKNGGFVEKPPAGSYLQVAASRRAEAENMLGFITGKTGLHGFVTPSTKPEIYRVIIGPLAGSEAIAKTRVTLGELGIKDMVVTRY